MFLGFANFYQKFIKNFAKDSLNITLTNREERMVMGRRTGKVIPMCKGPVLWTIKDKGRLKMEVNRSGFTMGAVLMQEQEGEWRPLTHMSKTYNLVEQNYHTGDQELLAIMKALKQWRQHLVGNRAFEIWTDH